METTIKVILNNDDVDERTLRLKPGGLVIGFAYHEYGKIIGSWEFVSPAPRAARRRLAMTKKDAKIWAEMARRKKQFHPDEEWSTLRLWGLFSWGTVSHLLTRGLLVTNMRKQNRTIWVWPSEEAYTKYILPLLDKPLDELTRLAGWVA